MKKQLKFLIAAGAIMLMPGLALGQATFTGSGDGSTWSDAANWDVGVPAGADANIGDGFTVTLATDQAVNDVNLVGDANTGTAAPGTATLNQTAGILTTASWMKIGGEVGGTTSNGTYNLSGSAQAVGQSFVQVGFNGGTGFLSISDSANFEASAGLNIAGGNVDVADVGQNSIGTLEVSGMATVTADRINMGGAGSTATVNQTGGTVTSNNWVAIANFGAGGTATYNISAGSVSANNGNFAVGQEGNGTLNVSGTGAVSQAGSLFAVGGLLEPGGFSQDGNGVLNITGSSATVSAVNVQVAGTATSTGTVSWTADSGGVTTVVSSGNTEFGPGTSNLVLDLSADPASATAGTEYLLVDNSAAVTGTFTGIAEGSTVSIGGGNTGTISYVGGADGFDIVVTAGAGGSVTGDFDGDGDVDCDDVDLFAGTFGSIAGGAPADRDLTGDGTVDLADALLHIETLVVTMPNGVTGTIRGDINCDGTVNVLGDAFPLVGNLGTNSGAVYTQGDLNFDGVVNVLGDAFTLVGNLGMSND